MYKVGDRVVSHFDKPRRFGVVVIWDDQREALGVRWEGFNYRDEYDCHDLYEDTLMPEEIYNSPLFAALKEDK